MVLSMIYRSKIEYADKSKNEYRVSIPDFFDPSFNISPEQYPMAKLGLSIPLVYKSGISIKDFLKVGVWVWCILIDGEPNYPVIIGFVDELIDMNETSLNGENSIYEINKKYGIVKKYENDNVNIRVDGNVDISLSGDGYKNLLTQLNDLKDIIVSLIGKYNSHKHEVITAQGVKGMAFAFGDSSSIPDSSAIDPHSIPDLTTANAGATASGVGIDPISGLTTLQISGRIAETTLTVAAELSQQGGETESTDGDWNTVFKSKQ